MGLFGVKTAGVHGSPAVASPTLTLNCNQTQRRNVGSPGVGPWSRNGQNSPVHALSRTSSSLSIKSANVSVSEKTNSQNASKRPAISRTHTAPSKTSAPLFPDEVVENLYISDLETACAVLSPNYAAPGRPKIKYILSLLENAVDQPKILEQVAGTDHVLKLIVINDKCDSMLIERLPEARDFIRTSLAANDGGVLVHCRKGVSRSGSVVVAHVMENLGMNMNDAITYVQLRRAKVLPSISFKGQLKLWALLKYSLVEDGGEEKQMYRKFRDDIYPSYRENDILTWTDKNVVL